jgi:hypothetical protein
MHLYLFCLSLCRLNAFPQGDFYAVSVGPPHKRGKIDKHISAVLVQFAVFVSINTRERA